MILLFDTTSAYLYWLLLYEQTGDKYAALNANSYEYHIDVDY